MDMIHERVFVGTEEKTAIELLNKWDRDFGLENIVSIQRVDQEIDTIRVFFLEK